MAGGGWISPSSSSTDKCGSFSWSGKLCTWLRSTSGKCRHIARPPPSPPFCSLFRSTSGRSRQRRSTSRCRRGPECRRCPTWGSSRKNWASSRSRPNPSWTAPCARDCKVSAGSCTSCARCLASSQCCWWALEMLRRIDPSGCLRPRGRKANASSKSAPYTIRSFRGIYTLASSRSKRAKGKQKRGIFSSTVHSMGFRQQMLIKSLVCASARSLNRDTTIRYRAAHFRLLGILGDLFIGEENAQNWTGRRETIKTVH